MLKKQLFFQIFFLLNFFSKQNLYGSSSDSGALANIAALETITKASTAKSQGLEQQINSLTSQNSRLETQVTDLKTKEELLETEKTDLEQIVKEQVSSLAQVQNELGQAQQAYDTSQGHLINTEQKRAQLETENNDLKLETTDLMQSIAFLEREGSSPELQRAIDKLIIQVIETQKIIETATKVDEEYDNALINDNNRLAEELNNKLEEHELLLTHLEQTEKGTGDLEVVLQENSKLASELSKTQAFLEQRGQQHHRLQTELQEKTGLYAHEVSSLEKQLDKIKQETVELQQENLRVQQELEEKVEEDTSINQGLINENQNLENQVSRSSEENVTLHTQLQNLQENLNTLEKENAGLNDYVTELAAENASKDQQLKELKQQAQEALFEQQSQTQQALVGQEHQARAALESQQEMVQEYNKELYNNMFEKTKNLKNIEEQESKISDLKQSLLYSVNYISKVTQMLKPFEEATEQSVVALVPSVTNETNPEINISGSLNQPTNIVDPDLPPQPSSPLAPPPPTAGPSAQNPTNLVFPPSQAIHQQAPPEEPRNKSSAPTRRPTDTNVSKQPKPLQNTFSFDSVIKPKATNTNWQQNYNYNSLSSAANNFTKRPIIDSFTNSHQTDPNITTQQH